MHTVRFPLATPIGLILSVGLGAPAVAAQSGAGMSASESYVLAVSSIAEGGGWSDGFDYSVIASVGQPFTVTQMSSSQYSFEYGPFATPDLLDFGTGPVVLGVGQAFGDKLGGNTVTVFGLNFGPPATFPSVRVGDKTALATQLRSNTAIVVDTPPGQNAYGNPLGAVAVTVTNDQGSHTRSDAFAYLPALLLNQPAHVGGHVDLRFVGPEHSSVSLATGVGGTAEPWANFDGMWELRPGWYWLRRDLYTAHGDTRIRVEIPDRAKYVGAILDFQACVLVRGNPQSSSNAGPTLSSPAGTFTNRLTVKVLP